MSLITIRAATAAGRASPAVYQIARRQIVADAPLRELSAFALAAAADEAPCLPLTQAAEGPLHCAFRGTGWVGNTWRQVASFVGAGGYRLDIEGVGVLAISPDGQAIASVASAPDCQPELLVEALLGPALVLALALSGVYCLHASAAAARGRVVAFIGESGSGKSTLAAYLRSRRAAGWRWVADDILPVASGASGLDALPHFPQLKVAPERQPGATCPAQLPLAAMYLLAGPSPEVEGIQVERLGQREALLALVRHTVGARLYDGALLERHLAFCAAWAQRLPIWRLSYPHRMALLPRVVETIEGGLDAFAQDESARWLV